MFYLLLATFGTILLTEMVGDKTVYTVSSLTVRFRPLHIFGGMSLAFMCKVLVAVAISGFVARLPAVAVAAASAATFFITGLVIWLKGRRPASAPASLPPPAGTHGIAMSFAAVFFTEWGDAGQITAAMLAARYHAPLLVWVAATLALMTKGALALALGLGLQKFIPQRMLRVVAVAACLIMGLLSVQPLFFAH